MDKHSLFILTEAVTLMAKSMADETCDGCGAVLSIRGPAKGTANLIDPLHDEVPFLMGCPRCGKETTWDLSLDGDGRLQVAYAVVDKVFRDNRCAAPERVRRREAEALLRAWDDAAARRNKEKADEKAR